MLVNYHRQEMSLFLFSSKNKGVWSPMQIKVSWKARRCWFSKDRESS